jgi:meiotically up-regulated gene 157 (Mug157) protein
MLLVTAELTCENRFSWANGLFGQMILDLWRRKPMLVARNYQEL